MRPRAWLVLNPLNQGHYLTKLCREPKYDITFKLCFCFPREFTEYFKK